MFSRQSTRFCVVIVQIVCFLVCWCCRWCELNRRRRVKRFKRCLRLRSCVYSLCAPASVFATLGGFILPSAAAVAVCAAAVAACRCCMLPLPAAAVACCAACLPAAAAAAAAARQKGGDRVLKVPRRGGGHLHVQF